MALPNTLSALLPTFFFAAQQIQREATGLLNSVTVNGGVEQIAVGMSATYDISPPAQAYTIQPGTLPSISGETAGSGTITISKQRAASFVYTGEEQRQLAIAGIYQNKYLNQIMERMRTLRNEIELDLAVLYPYASRATGTAGTAPFAVNLSASPTVTGLEPFSDMNKAMTESGSPGINRFAALDAVAAGKCDNIPNLTRVNEAGNQNLLRTGEIGSVKGYMVRTSGGIQKISTMGGGTSYVLDGAHPKGSTAIKVKTGSGTILAGDPIVFSGDTGRTYVVKTGIAAAGTLYLNRPGLMVDLSDGATVTVNTTAFTPNLYGSKDAIHLVQRHPYLPQIGVNAEGAGGAGGLLLDVANIPDIDPITKQGTGLIYQVAMWSMYRQIMVEIALNWGAAVVNPQNLFVELG